MLVSERIRSPRCKAPRMHAPGLGLGSSRSRFPPPLSRAAFNRGRRPGAARRAEAGARGRRRRPAPASVRPRPNFVQPTLRISLLSSSVPLQPGHLGTSAPLLSLGLSLPPKPRAAALRGLASGSLHACQPASERASSLRADQDGGGAGPCARGSPGSSGGRGSSPSSPPWAGGCEERRSHRSPPKLHLLLPSPTFTPYPGALAWGGGAAQGPDLKLKGVFEIPKLPMSNTKGALCLQNGRLQALCPSHLLFYF